jgi:hypothetical protein
MGKLQIIIGFVVLVCASTLSVYQPASARANDPHAETGMAIEVVGQAINPPPNLSFQYGYLSYIKGIDLGAIAAGGPMSERTALFTFYNDTVTERVITNGRLRVLNRVGTMGIYLDPSLNGNWGQLRTFQDGEQIVSAQLRHQNVFDTQTGAFTTYFDMTTVWSKPFTLGDQTYQLGKAGDQWSLHLSGHSDPSSVPNAYFGGYVRGLELKK